ncbi:MAG: acyl-CoA thioesterase [Pseudoxanthomonas sp.]|nr:acyl-CoA thioesterase [Pseudoxanthomonas sp.]
MSNSAEAAPAPRVVFRTTLPVRWGDMDAFGHVNNAQYLRYLEEARVQWMESLPGVSMGAAIAPVLAASQVNYRKAIEWPARITVELSIVKVGTRSLTVGHRMLSAAADAQLHCDGSVVLVWVDRSSGQSVPLPQAIRRGAG